MLDEGPLSIGAEMPLTARQEPSSAMGRAGRSYWIHEILSAED